MSFCTQIKLFALVLGALLILTAEPASATKRVALVMGNSTYQNAPLLPNPANDAAAIAATLKAAGFDVVDSRLNLAATDMKRVLRDFADQARDADIALVYYAGHGIEIDGTNYLIPTDARLERDTDIYDEAFSLDRVLLAIEPARQLRLVIVDACRNNPFADTMKRTVASRSIQSRARQGRAHLGVQYTDRLRRKSRVNGARRQQQEQARTRRLWSSTSQSRASTCAGSSALSATTSCKPLETLRQELLRLRLVGRRGRCSRACCQGQGTDACGGQSPVRGPP